jgi:hypothetical protein
VAITGESGDSETDTASGTASAATTARGSSSTGQDSYGTAADTTPGAGSPGFTLTTGVVGLGIWLYSLLEQE